MDFCFGHFLRGKNNPRNFRGFILLKPSFKINQNPFYARYRYRWKERNFEICFGSFTPKVGMAHFH